MGAPLLTSLSQVADLMSVVLGPIGLALGIGGLIYAIKQLHKTRDAAVAAAKSAERTSRALIQNH
jgi:hypothetical protein